MEVGVEEVLVIGTTLVLDPKVVDVAELVEEGQDQDGEMVLLEVEPMVLLTLVEVLAGHMALAKMDLLVVVV
jgi:hypothetical protein